MELGVRGISPSCDPLVGLRSPAKASWGHPPDGPSRGHPARPGLILECQRLWQAGGWAGGFVLREECPDAAFQSNPSLPLFQELHQPPGPWASSVGRHHPTVSRHALDFMSRLCLRSVVARGWRDSPRTGAKPWVIATSTFEAQDGEEAGPQHPAEGYVCTTWPCESLGCSPPHLHSLLLSSEAPTCI